MSYFQQPGATSDAHQIFTRPLLTQPSPDVRCVSTLFLKTKHEGSRSPRVSGRYQGRGPTLAAGSVGLSQVRGPATRSGYLHTFVFLAASAHSRNPSYSVGHGATNPETGDRFAGGHTSDPPSARSSDWH